jgi:phosphoserine aminotransferase
MTNKDALIKEIESLSPSCLDEVVDFVEYIKQKQLKNTPATMLLSEASLALEWDTPEEDAAWKDL